MCVYGRCGMLVAVGQQDDGVLKNKRDMKMRETEMFLTPKVNVSG